MRATRRTGEGTRVLLVEPCFENFGGYYRAFGMARGLTGQGFDVTLLLSNRGPGAWRLCTNVVSPNLRVVKLPRLEWNTWVNGRLLRGCLGLLYCLFGRYDLVHLFTIVQLESLVPFLFLRIFMRWKKVVLDWDDYWTEQHTQLPSPSVYEHPLVRWYLRFCEYRVQALAVHGTATSEFLSEEFRRIGVQHVHKIINGVDTRQCDVVERGAARKRLGLPADALIFLAFGNSYRRARTVYLFKLFGLIAQAEPSAQLHINIDPHHLWQKYGAGETLPEGTMERMQHVGYLAGDALSNQLGACDAVLFMMSDSPSEQACFPTRVGTYLNGERFIVMNDNKAEACRILKEHDCAIIEADLPGLAERTLAVLRSPAERRRMEDNVRSAKQALSWENLTRGLAAFYDEIG